MKTLYLTLLLSIICFFAEAQSDRSAKTVYLSRIYFFHNPMPLHGILVETNDSTIQIINRAQLKKALPYASQNVPISSIKKIKVRKKGNVGRGMLLGGLSGALTGAAIGYAGGDDECPPNGFCFLNYSAEEKAVASAIGLLLPGMAIGAILGSSSKTIHINGEQNLYNLAKDELQAFSLKE